MDHAKREFEQLVEPHFDALYRAALRLTRRHPDAEDLVQEVCIRAFHEIGQLGQLDYVAGWLLRVQYRLFVDSDRRRKRSPLRPSGSEDCSDQHWVSESPGPEELADAAASARSMDKAWRNLSTDQQALLALHAEGYDLAELEQITGRNRSQLSARLYRARQRLASLMESTELNSMPERMVRVLETGGEEA